MNLVRFRFKVRHVFNLHRNDEGSFQHPLINRFTRCTLRKIWGNRVVQVQVIELDAASSFLSLSGALF